MKELSWKVGGQQGEGIDSTGEILSSVLSKKGYFLYRYRHFSSRIKGGHTNDKVRISTTPVRSISDSLEILVAFDQETIDLNYKELIQHAVVLADEKFNPVLPDDVAENVQLYSIPFEKMAKELSSPIMKNMVAIGSSCVILGLNVSDFDSIIETNFSKKGVKIIQNNKQALLKGFSYLKETLNYNQDLFYLEPSKPNEQLFMIGNHAIALGALASGVRIMSAYPITPASEIMEYLIEKLPKFGGTVVQTEDEIAAATMAIGANYAGVRSFTASAGPGLSLMMEAIGLSGMTETPLVVVDTQRGGPSTGLPTKQEQSDVYAAIYGTHGDIPKIVLAPSTVEEAFYDTVEAFNLAEKYQCPVILLSDLQLSLGKQSTPVFDFHRVSIDRGKLTKEIQNIEEAFKRYEMTTDGVSPRSIPGVKGGIHHVTGVEHNEVGRPSENSENRVSQMDKRMNKIKNLSLKNPVVSDEEHDDADVLLVSMGSTRGAMEEAKNELNNDGVSANTLTVRQLHPFPVKPVKNAFGKAKKIIVIDHNANAQLKGVIQKNMQETKEIKSILKYDGNPFTSNSLVKEIKELI